MNAIHTTAPADFAEFMAWAGQVAQAKTDEKANAAARKAEMATLARESGMGDLADLLA